MPPMSVHCFVVYFIKPDPRSQTLYLDAHNLGFTKLKKLICQDLFFIEGQLSSRECEKLALELLSDPITQNVDWFDGPGIGRSGTMDYQIIDVCLRPGVTDPVAFQLVRAAHELNIKKVLRAATGSRYLVDGLDAKQVGELACRLLANPTIHRWAMAPIEPSFPENVASSGELKIINICRLGDEALMHVSQSRRTALDIDEMKVIQSYFIAEGRDPYDVELETLAQTWSEHCQHKTFRAKIRINESNNRTIDSLYNTYLRSATAEIGAPWVRSAFADNAGIIDFDDKYEVSFKVETHNHPSAIEPFGGANTGVGGVIRDVLGVSAKPIANTDVICFGPQSISFDNIPEGVLHPKMVLSGVVAGIQDYGNKMGIPTVNGTLWFDAGYIANPLVFCGTVGIAPKGYHPVSPHLGDHVIILGGRTGRDGLRGATFSSMTMDALAGEVSGASVQIGDPITEKTLMDVLLLARDQSLYNAVTDCGAGGLSSAVGEMASSIGADVELAHVHLKYPGLAPWEIWLSEAQERMIIAVPGSNIPALKELCATYDTELTDIGIFTGSGRLVVRYNNKIVLDLDNIFLHKGAPQRKLSARIKSPGLSCKKDFNHVPADVNIPDVLIKLLSHPNICSRTSIVRLYDHEVQGGTVVKPLVGLFADAPSDAAVIKPMGTSGVKGIVLSNGFNPEYGKKDPYLMALAVMDEAVRNAIAVGADPERLAVLDNFCWGDPLNPNTLGLLAEAARGCYDGAKLFGTPFISGKDSLNNEYLGMDGKRHAIPPTLLISAIGIIHDISRAVTMDLKQAGNFLYLVGEFSPTFTGSHFALISGMKCLSPHNSIPLVSQNTPGVYRALHTAVSKDLVCSCHDLSEGGLAVAASEMMIGGRLGLDLCLVSIEPIKYLFAETTGCLLVEINPQNAAAFNKIFENLPSVLIGRITETPHLNVSIEKHTILNIGLTALLEAWSRGI